MYNFLLKNFLCFNFAFFVLFCVPVFSEDTNLKSPPKEQPVLVTTKMHLLNLFAIDGRSETFKADIYLEVSWLDKRLAFSHSEPLIYADEAAKHKIENIWWPQLEFVNTTAPEIANRSLTINPDGTVKYFLGLNAIFRTPYDFHKFPFDKQELNIIVCSFIWNESVVQFVTTQDFVDFEVDKNKIVDGFSVRGIKGEIIHEEGPWHEKNDHYSCFKGTILVERNSVYYIYQICLPVLIVLAFGCCIFITDPKEFANRLMLGLSCMFVFIATKLSINVQLPEIAYITVADQIFFLAYLNVAVILLISLIESYLFKKKSPLFRKFDQAALWFMPMIFFCLFLIILVNGAF